MENAKCKHGHRSTISNSAWCDLNKNCTVLKLLDLCHNLECNCQKQLTFSPKQKMLEGKGFKKTRKIIFKGSQTAWNKFLKLAVNVAAPFNGMAVSAKSKNPKVGQVTTNILKSISGGKISSLNDMHGNGMRLKIL